MATVCAEKESDTHTHAHPWHNFTLAYHINRLHRIHSCFTFVLLILMIFHFDWGDDDNNGDEKTDQSTDQRQKLTLRIWISKNAFEIHDENVKEVFFSLDLLEKRVIMSIRTRMCVSVCIEFRKRKKRWRSERKNEAYRYRSFLDVRIRCQVGTFKFKRITTKTTSIAILSRFFFFIFFWSMSTAMYEHVKIVWYTHKYAHTHLS